jgi:hypothetical protein
MATVIRAAANIFFMIDLSVDLEALVPHSI